MTPLRPGELSAYLDGELSAEREREVENILSSEPAARAEFDAIAAADAGWRSYARSAAFHPRVSLPAQRDGAIPIWVVVAFVGVLIAMQFALERLGVLALTVALNGAAFAIVLIVLRAETLGLQILRNGSLLRRMGG